MRLLNLTDRSSKDLTKLLKAGLESKGADHRDYIVHVSYSKKNMIWGYAFYGRMITVYCNGKKINCNGKKFFRITLPKNKEINMKELAQTIEHEIDHTLGLRHGDMLKWWQLEPTWHTNLSLA